MKEPATEPYGFLGLPLELRETIYEALLLQTTPISMRHLQRSIYSRQNSGGVNSVPQVWTGILSVSKQVSEEALRVLYTRNIFLLRITNWDWRSTFATCQDILRLFGTDNLRRIRHVRLLLVAQDVGYPYWNIPAADVFIPLLDSLSTLRIATKRAADVYGADFRDRAGFEGPTYAWPEWLGMLLRTLDENLVSNTKVEIDDGGVSRTDRLVAEYFPRAYRKVRIAFNDNGGKDEMMDLPTTL